MDNSVLINIINVSQQFGPQVVLKDINLKIFKGEIIGVLGPSGSGKTTLVKIIVGMSNPKNGSVEVLNHKMPNLNITSKIGYMAQSDALYDELTAYDNLKFFGSLYDLKGENLKTRINEVLQLVHLENDKNKQVKNFSGGMKRRLSLAIALLHDPEILILDEPTVGIDPVLRREFWTEFERLKSLGKTIIVTTHVMDEAEHCDRLALTRGGNIIALGSPAELKQLSKKTTIEDAFLYFGEKEEI